MSPQRRTDSTAPPSTSTTRSRPALSRRAVIAAGSTATLASLAGCSAIVNRLAEMALNEVNVFNGADRPVSGTIEIVDPNDEVVLEETFELEAESENSEDEATDEATAQYGDVWTDAGDYDVSIELEETLAADSGTAGNETEPEPESEANSTDADTESAGNSSDADIDNETSATNESADNAGESETDEGSDSGTSATETVTVSAPDEEHLVVGIDQDETEESISFHVIEEFSDLGEEFE